MSTPFDAPQHSGTAHLRLNSLPAEGGGGCAGRTTNVDTQRLDEAANALVELRGDTENVDNTADDDCLNASRNLNKYSAGGMAEAGSWATAGSLVTMDVRWGSQVLNLKRLLQDISDKLHATKGHYTRTEQEERARQNSISTPFG
ncbi:hypothetical protein SAMN04487981_13138 [Streptomyces sp. cf386]|uniref:hypothetical protein n=1 Tax=Streptomyces sp. cf386 TaxID=1761904 RepID=UPI00088FB950|nr:hypothetical protein [Streptomyces sp. cf386]SDP65455.1 hypothetical protein SAMN04487981_13138 [Streptomyces sp. cf386]